MEEVIGRVDADAVLRCCGLSLPMKTGKPLEPGVLVAYDDVGEVSGTLEQLYGVRGGRGLALKAGRACFTFALREYGKSLGLWDLDFRLLPPAVKIKTGLQRFASLLSQSGDSPIRLEEDADQLRWVVENCPLCWHRHAEVPICHMQVGLLQEYLYWASCGKNYSILETECIAAGAKACVFAIDKVALD